MGEGRYQASRGLGEGCAAAVPTEIQKNEQLKIVSCFRVPFSAPPGTESIDMNLTKN